MSTFWPFWTDLTFDYLEPSTRLARRTLNALEEKCVPEITRMTLEHHKFSPYRGDPQWLDAPFRRAVWVDVTCGFFSFGLSRSMLRDAFLKWLDAGHKWHFYVELRRLRIHLLNSPPMMRGD